jgi:hypothetical protein
MNKRLKELAEQAGFDKHHVAYDTRIERFAELVRQDEREACADSVFKMAQLPEFDAAWVVLHEAQSAIRARGNNEQD